MSKSERVFSFTQNVQVFFLGKFYLLSFDTTVGFFTVGIVNVSKIYVSVNVCQSVGEL